MYLLLLLSTTLIGTPSPQALIKPPTVSTLISTSTDTFHLFEQDMAAVWSGEICQTSGSSRWIGPFTCLLHDARRTTGAHGLSPPKSPSVCEV
ncbi:hypothetical protein BDN72DRAFT_75288 [Pluteus cervinus]|uniref:Uncharacterized protein n=1 Tax=Pluteus cervinus TaxID=181527 RepID=A0ACD3ASF3_9AGAR|nr:hypothetical protein BDN72DRAFT_75288 [Pluteus cervinus]